MTECMCDGVHVMVCVCDVCMCDGVHVWCVMVCMCDGVHV